MAGGKKGKGVKGAGRGRGRGGRKKTAVGGGRGGGAPLAQARGLQLRLKQLQSHLIMKTVNYLDEASRKVAFCVLGWPMDNYVKRKAALRQQLVQQRRQQLQREEKRKQEEQAQANKENDTPVVAEEGGKGGAPRVAEGGGGEGAAQGETHRGETAKKSQEETNQEEEADQAVPVKETKELMIREEDMTFSERDLLPLLSARVDPNTLLDRLNSRRLYLRILNFKRKEREGREDATSQTLSDHEKERRDFREERTRERIYRKNMNIAEMAQLEWDELIEMADLRNIGQEALFEPIPTQHELLLFTPCPRAVAVLASYPRSGNSLLRTMYEHTTLRVTGSDMQGGLAKHDLVGEMAVGENMVQFVKTHFPERQGSTQFRAAMAVVLVRNPFDAMESYFNLMMTGTHTNSLTDEHRKKTAQAFEEYVLREIRVWIGFHRFWLSQDIPRLLIRYEDLIRDPDKVMSRVLEFVLEIKYMNTFFSERIDRCIKDQAKIERMGSYKPRSGGIGKSLAKYSPELFQKLMSNKDLRQVMTSLGYAHLLENPVEEWSNLKHLTNYATLYLPSWHLTDRKKVVLLNKGNLVRTKTEHTNWMQLKNGLGIFEQDCKCDKCEALRQKAKEAEQAKSGSGDEVGGEHGKTSETGQDKIGGEQGVAGKSGTNDQDEKGNKQGQSAIEKNANDQTKNSAGQGESNSEGDDVGEQGEKAANGTDIVQGGGAEQGDNNSNDKCAGEQEKTSVTGENKVGGKSCTKSCCQGVEHKQEQAQRENIANGWVENGAGQGEKNCKDEDLRKQGKNLAHDQDKAEGDQGIVRGEDSKQVQDTSKKHTNGQFQNGVHGEDKVGKEQGVVVQIEGASKQEQGVSTSGTTCMKSEEAQPEHGKASHAVGPAKACLPRAEAEQAHVARANKSAAEQQDALQERASGEEAEVDARRKETRVQRKGADATKDPEPADRIERTKTDFQETPTGLLEASSTGATIAALRDTVEKLRQENAALREQEHVLETDKEAAEKETELLKGRVAAMERVSRNTLAKERAQQADALALAEREAQQWKMKADEAEGAVRKLQMAKVAAEKKVEFLRGRVATMENAARSMLDVASTCSE